ncbi:MAG: sigma-70 family RNA polymerase sigma factor [Planctomycetota bacterium]
MDAKNQASAYDELVERNRGRLTAIARAYAPGDVDDLLQEILLQLWRSLSSFKGEAGIDTWAYRVALNTALGWRRSASTRRDRLPQSERCPQSISGGDDGQDHVALLEKFIATLSAPDRALLLMILEDMPGKEMASVFGVREGAVRVRVHRLKARLQQWAEQLP